MSNHRKAKTPVPVHTPVRPKINFFQEKEAWLGKKQKHVLLVIISISVLFRIFYFVQLNQGPGVWQQRFEDSDMYFYDQWAKFISQGDWLSDSSYHQYNAPQQWIADAYFKKHPEKALEFQKQLGHDNSKEALGRLLWEQWDGGKIYHQDPLYIYIVAVVYKIFGEDVRYVFVLQMIIGLFTVILIYLITRKHFGNIAALVSGFIAAFCGPLMYYELVLVRESIIVFAGLFLVYKMDKTRDQASAKNYFLLGVTIALCILLKSTFILFLLLTIGITFFTFRDQRKLFLKYTLILLAGAALMYSPLVIRNSIIGVPLFTQNAVGAVSVISSNEVNFKPEEGYEFHLENTVNILEKTEGKIFPSFIETLKTHPGVFSYIQLLIKKIALVFHWYEFPNNKNFYYYKLHAPVLNFSFISFLVIAPLALAGIAASIINRKKTEALYLLLIMHLALLVGFLVLSRYRIPMQAAMIPFAGYAVAEIIKNFKSKIKYAWILIAGIALSAMWVGRALPEKITLIRGVDYQQPYYFYYKPIIDADLAKGDVNGALKTMENFMKLEPTDVKKLNSSSVSPNSFELVLAKVYSGFHSIYSDLATKAGNELKASLEADRAKELQNLVAMNDNSGSAESLLLKAAASEGPEKQKYFRDLVNPLKNEIKLYPNNPNAYRTLNEAYQNLNLPDSAIFVLQELLKLNSNDFYTLFQLGTVYGKFKNDAVTAAQYLEKAKIIDPQSEDVYLNLGIVYSILQQNELAVGMMQKAAEINPFNKNNLNNLELLLRNMGRIKEADEIKNKR